LRVSENRVLRGIFGPKREEVTGGWIKLHRNFIMYPSHQISLELSNQRG
jgi:hypothetical protein